MEADFQDRALDLGVYTRRDLDALERARSNAFSKDSSCILRGWKSGRAGGTLHDVRNSLPEGDPDRGKRLLTGMSASILAARTKLFPIVNRTWYAKIHP